MRTVGGVILRPVGLQEIAWLHDTRQQTAWKWSTRRLLPEPDFVVSGKHLWIDVADIEAWSRGSGRDRFTPAITRWAKHLRRIVTVEGEQVPDPSLSFTELYDLLGLGQEKTRLQEIGLPTAAIRAE